MGVYQRHSGNVVTGLRHIIAAINRRVEFLSFASDVYVAAVTIDIGTSVGNGGAKKAQLSTACLSYVMSVRVTSSEPA